MTGVLIPVFAYALSVEEDAEIDAALFPSSLIAYSERRDPSSSEAVGGVCGWTKVGSNLFLTAAHCRKNALQKIAQGQSESAVFGGRFVVWNGAESVYIRSTSLVVSDIKNTGKKLDVIADFFLDSVTEFDVRQEANKRKGSDVALVWVANPTPQIPVAELDLSQLNIGDSVVLTGSGCRTQDIKLCGTGDDADLFFLQAAQTTIKEIQSKQFLTPGQRRFFLFYDYRVPGLRPGDSGSAVYRKSGDQYRIVGINAAVHPDSNFVTHLNDQNSELIGAWIQRTVEKIKSISGEE